jgi:hypothetical protein
MGLLIFSPCSSRLSAIKIVGIMPDTKEEIERRMDELAREYGRTPPGDPRRSEIFKELSALCERLDRLVN